MKNNLKIIGLLFATQFCSAQTIPLYIGTGNSDGIYQAELNVKTGELSAMELAAKVYRPSALAISVDKKFLFAVGRVADENGKYRKGSIYSFKIGEDFSLKEISQQTWMGSGGCYVFAHENGENCFMADYAGGSVSSFKIGEDGALSEAVSKIQHTGSSVHETRQKKPHAHSIYSSPDGAFVYAADLGTDEVVYYQLHQPSAALKLVGGAKVPAGSGPRHMAFNKDGSKLYVLNELTLTVSVFDRDAGDGSLKMRGTHPVTTTFGEGFSCSEIRFSDDFNHLYAAKRDLEGKGRDLISVLDPKSLEILQEHPAGGSVPRHFNISPSGEWLVVAATRSNEIIVHKRDAETGKLSRTEFKSTVALPMWILFP